MELEQTSSSSLQTVDSKAEWMVSPRRRHRIGTCHSQVTLCITSKHTANQEQALQRLQHPRIRMALMHNNS